MHIKKLFFIFSVLLSTVVNASTLQEEEQYKHKLQAESLISDSEMMQAQKVVGMGKTTYQDIYKHIMAFPEVYTLQAANETYKQTLNPSIEKINQFNSNWENWFNQQPNKNALIEEVLKIRDIVNSYPFAPIDAVEVEVPLRDVYPQPVAPKWGIFFKRYNEWQEKIINIVIEQQPTRNLGRYSKEHGCIVMRDVSFIQSVKQMGILTKYTIDRLAVVLNLVIELQEILDGAPQSQLGSQLNQVAQAYNAIGAHLDALSTYYQDCELMYMVAQLKALKAQIPEQEAQEVQKWWRTTANNPIGMDQVILNQINQIFLKTTDSFYTFLKATQISSDNIMFMLREGRLPPLSNLHQSRE